MRISRKKDYRITAKDKDTKYIASTTDSFDNLAGILYWARRASANAHRTLAYVQVYCIDDDEVNEYTTCGRLIK